MQSLGATVVMMERFDAREALHALEKHAVTHSQWVPTMFTRMLKLPEEERSRLRSLRITGWRSTPPLLARGR